MNFDYLKNNITELSINTSNLTNPYEISNNISQTADNMSGGYLGLGIMVIMFFVFVFLLFRDDGEIRMDIARSIMLSSGFVSIVGVLLLVIGWTSSFVHVMWFVTIFVISVISVVFMKKKGL
jgi:pheromone shutdown protein TraB